MRIPLFHVMVFVETTPPFEPPERDAGGGIDRRLGRLLRDKKLLQAVMAELRRVPTKDDELGWVRPAGEAGGCREPSLTRIQ